MLEILVWVACIVVLLPAAVLVLAVIIALVASALAWIGVIPKKKEGKFYG